MKNGLYTININKDDKIIEMNIAGTFLPETADSFHQDYLNKIRPICTNDYILKINCLDMDVITKDMFPKLQISLVLYKKSEFKRIQILIQKKLDIKKQIERLLLFAGIENADFIEQP